jgi:hypothetical protein
VEEVAVSETYVIPDAKLALIQTRVADRLPLLL